MDYAQNQPNDAGHAAAAAPDNEELPADARAGDQGDASDQTAPVVSDAHGTVSLNPNADMTAGTGNAIITPARKLDILHNLSQEVVLLMGLSFILGVLFTVFVLLVLDFMRRNNDPTLPR